MPLKILISGSSGFIGKSLSSFLEAQGHQVVSLVKEDSSKKRDCVVWNPKTGEGKVKDFEGFDAVIHLAGESLVKGFWTAKKKRRILESRSLVTTRLVHILERTEAPPKVFLSASAIGYYGTQKGLVTEKTPHGTGFLSEVCQAWEAASKPLEQKGVRVVFARLGVVLSCKGGFLKALLPFFRLGLGGKIGNGDQMISWIALEDLMAAFYHILVHKDLKGPVNIVAPYPVSQEFFVKTLSGLLSRPCFFSFPRSLFPGEKAKELLFSSLDVKPSKLHKADFYFMFPTLEAALERSLELL